MANDQKEPDPAASAITSFPQYPPGLWRRIRLHPSPGRIAAGLEDDVHRFLIALAHENGVITGVTTKAERFPWSTCPDSGPFLEQQLTGRHLADVTALDPHIHCTHFFELAVLAAAHAHDSSPIQFDIQVADRVDGLTSATLLQNGKAVLRWNMRGTMIEGPPAWAGRDLRKLSTWKQDLPPDLALHAMMMRRAIMVSGARAQPEHMAGRAADRGPGRMGACFTYQMPRALDATQTANWRHDFSHSGQGPLQDFDPDQLMPGDGTRA